MNTDETVYYGVYAGEMLVTVCVGREEANTWILMSGDAYPDLVAKPLPPGSVTRPQPGQNLTA